MRKSTLLGLLVVGSLLAAGPVLAAPAQEKEVRDMVEAAARILAQKGAAALPELQDPAVWRRGDSYLFVFDGKGTELVNAGTPAMVGKNVWDYRDPDGKYPAREQWAIIEKSGAGWCDSKWAKPGGTTPVPNRAYVKGVRLPDGRLLGVGSSYYPE